MRKLPKDVLKMASGLISPSGLAGHRRPLCNVSHPRVTRGNHRLNIGLFLLLQVTLLDIGQLRVGKGYLMVTVGQQG